MRTRIDWKNYKPVGVQSVDMCASVIFGNRVKSIPIKAVHLLPRMYGQFKLWAEKNLERELLPDEKLEFDGVYIEEGSDQQTTPLLVELWEQHAN